MVLRDSAADDNIVCVPAAFRTIAVSTTVRNGTTEKVTADPIAISPMSFCPRFDETYVRGLKNRLSNFGSDTLGIFGVSSKSGTNSDSRGVRIDTCGDDDNNVGVPLFIWMDLLSRGRSRSNLVIMNFLREFVNRYCGILRDDVAVSKILFVFLCGHS